MLRQVALRCLESTKKTSKPLWLTNLKISRLGPEAGPCYSIHQLDHRHHYHACSSATPQPFTVRRSEPELVGPREATPREVKPLSDIDDQNSFHTLAPLVYLYGHDPRMQGKDPARVIRDALARALVFYYPLAGRLRLGPGRKLSVDCTGEGAVFVEADADVELSFFGDSSGPPLAYFDKLLYHLPGPAGVDFDAPILFVQVTRLKCGGFILALRMNHTMSDAQGIAQFLTAVAQIARGADAPSVMPVWSRDIFSARDPPRVTCTLRQYDMMEGLFPVRAFDNPNISYRSIYFGSEHLQAVHMTHRSFFFGPSDLLAIRKSTPRDTRAAPTTFEVLTAFLWRCYTRALQLDPEDEVRLLCIVNARGKKNFNMPAGYYGNAIATPAAVTTAGELCRGGSTEHTLELLRKAKEEVDEEYMRSLAGAMVIKGRPCLFLRRTLLVSDLRRAGLADLDFGWGKAVYAGPPGIEAEGCTFYIPYKKRNGEEGIWVPLCLPPQTMERFETELTNMLGHQST